MKEPLKRAVCNRKNSSVGTSGVTLDDLDFSKWWTDTSFGQNYLKVPHKNGETIHRVLCRLSSNPRLMYENGKLYWLIDQEVSKNG